MGALAGYAFARLRFPGKGIWFLACLSVFMVPSQVTLIPDFAGTVTPATAGTVTRAGCGGHKRSPPAAATA